MCCLLTCRRLSVLVLDGLFINSLKWPIPGVLNHEPECSSLHDSEMIVSASLWARPIQFLDPWRSSLTLVSQVWMPVKPDWPGIRIWVTLLVSPRAFSASWQLQDIFNQPDERVRTPTAREYFYQFPPGWNRKVSSPGTVSLANRWGAAKSLF